MTKPQKTLIAAIDTSTAGRSVFKKALMLASSVRARVIAVSVTPRYDGNMNRLYLNNPEQQLDEPFEKILKEAMEYSISLGINMTAIHRRGKPEEEIVAVAQEENASLILLGSTKRCQLERLLFGRTIAEMITTSHCDLLIAPEQAEIRFRHLLVEINDSSSSREAEQRAFDIAHTYGSTVHGLIALDLPPESSLRYGVARDAEQKARKTLKHFIELSKRYNIPAHTVIQWEAPEKSLTDYARKKDIDLIVAAGNSATSVTEILTGSVIERLTSLTLCPILVTTDKRDKGSRHVRHFFYN